MCTSIISNRNKTIVGWNLDILDMEYRVRESTEGVYIEINDKSEGWMPLFGANDRGDFVGMPTCWPFDERSNPKGNEPNVIMLDIDLLTKKRTLQEIKEIAESGPVCSIPGVTFMSSLSDKDGNVLHVIPGQGYKYYEKPVYQVLTNFSPFKMDKEHHPWMGWERYHVAKEMLENASDDFDVSECFDILKAVSQEVCPTVVSMVFDASEMKVYWCEGRQWDRIKMKQLEMNLKLIRPSFEYADQVMKYREEMLANNDSLDGCARLEEVTSFAEWIDFENRLKKIYGDGYVPSEVFLAVRSEDKKVVGIIDYRHPLSPFLYKYGGNIGYSTLPTERRKGYASEMLRLLLPICKEYGEEKVLLTCDKNNDASRRTIVKNGGMLENEIADDVGLSASGTIQRYWIIL